MIVIACVDKKYGMLFNRRRQSQDRLLRSRILERAEQSRLWMNTYSSKQFKEGLPSHVFVSEDFLALSGPNDFCFVEDADLTSYQDKITGIILYHWNREYPADHFFTLDMTPFMMQAITDFPGSSHKIITEEVYTT